MLSSDRFIHCFSSTDEDPHSSRILSSQLIFSVRCASDSEPVDATNSCARRFEFRADSNSAPIRIPRRFEFRVSCVPCALSALSWGWLASHRPPVGSSYRLPHDPPLSHDPWHGQCHIPQPHPSTTCFMPLHLSLFTSLHLPPLHLPLYLPLHVPLHVPLHIIAQARHGALIKRKRGAVFQFLGGHARRWHPREGSLVRPGKHHLSSVHPRSAAGLA